MASSGSSMSLPCAFRNLRGCFYPLSEFMMSSHSFARNLIPKHSLMRDWTIRSVGVIMSRRMDFRIQTRFSYVTLFAARL